MDNKEIDLNRCLRRLELAVQCLDRASRRLHDSFDPKIIEVIELVEDEEKSLRKFIEDIEFK